MADYRDRQDRGWEFRKGRATRKARGARGAVSVVVSEADVLRINDALRKLPQDVWKKVYVKAFRGWAKNAVRTAKALAPIRTGRLRKSIFTKVKRYRKAVWGGLGGKVAGGKAAIRASANRGELGKDYLGAGWRIHLAERGFHPRGGPTKVPGRFFLREAGLVHGPVLVKRVEDAVEEAIREGGLR
jgi:hypothetical protein